jgi:hypothetical protein
MARGCDDPNYIPKKYQKEIKLVAPKKKARTGNRSKMVMDAAIARFKPFEQFHCDNLKVDGLDQRQIGSALSMLAKKGMVEHGALRGYYSLPNGAKKSQPVNPAQAIYDLLDFMAKAEPALKRAAKILEAVDNA